jgi:predicted DNA-binding protein
MEDGMKVIRDGGPVGAGDPGGTVKVSLNLPTSVIRKVKRLSERQQRTMTEVIRRAIEMEDYVESVREQNGKILVKKDDELRELIIR